MMRIAMTFLLLSGDLLHADLKRVPAEPTLANVSMRRLLTRTARVGAAAVREWPSKRAKLIQRELDNQ